MKFDYHFTYTFFVVGLTVVVGLIVVAGLGVVVGFSVVLGLGVVVGFVVVIDGVVGLEVVVGLAVVGNVGFGVSDNTVPTMAKRVMSRIAFILQIQFSVFETNVTKLCFDKGFYTDILV